MSEVTLKAEIRKTIGKASALRRTGKVPGIYYGRDMANIPLAVPELTLRPLYATSATHVITLSLDDGSTHPCILKDIAFDPVTERPVHFDLLGLRAGEELTLDIPVILTGGTPKGVREGGILQHVLHKVQVSCLPKDIPEKITVDVSELLLNRSIHVSELSIPNVTILEDPKSTVVAVIPPVVEKEPEAAAAEAEAATAEPEVIGKGKKTDEDEEGAAEKPKPEKSEKGEKKEKKEKE